jgi:hypothetical protein
MGCVRTEPGTSVEFASTVSLKTTLVAASGPLLVTVTV